MRKLFFLPVLLLSLFVGVASTSEAAFYDGNKLLSQCRPTANDENRVYKLMACVSYIAGVSDAGGEPQNDVLGYRFCNPLSVTTGQEVDIVVKWLRANPEQRHYVAAGLVAKALSKAFPCK